MACPRSQPAEIAGSSYAHCARERTVATIIACSSPSPRGEGRGEGDRDPQQPEPQPTRNTRLHQPTVLGPSVALNTFQNLWHEILAAEAPPNPPLTVFEPACGSANDYRFLHSCGLSRLLDYTGLDLCAKNVENARALFPEVRFEQGNIFEINTPDNAFDLAFVHDLFEHLSIEGLDAAVKEVCRVTRRAICANFFQMGEIPDHLVRPTDEYHWNLLSMDQIKKLFATHGFSGQLIHIKSFLRQEFGCDYTHNPNAYTFVLHRA